MLRLHNPTQLELPAAIDEDQRVAIQHLVQALAKRKKRRCGTTDEDRSPEGWVLELVNHLGNISTSLDSGAARYDVSEALAELGGAVIAAMGLIQRLDRNYQRALSNSESAEDELR